MPKAYEHVTSELQTYPGNFAPHLGEVLLLCPGEQLLPAGDGQDDGVGHAVVVQAQIHCTFKVPCQQSLCDQPIHICNETGQMLPQKPLRDAAAGDTVQHWHSCLQSSLLQAMYLRGDHLHLRL